MSRNGCGGGESRRMFASPAAAHDRPEADLREELARACRRIVSLGLQCGTAGNVSVRYANRMLVTPSGIPYEELTPDQIALVDDAGRYGGPCAPSSEWRLHRALLAARPDAGAVVHTHSVFATTLACLRREIPALHYYVAFGGGPTIPCAAYATYGSRELADNAVAVLADRDACLLANHGLVALGSTLARALNLAADVETLARQYVYALHIGEPHILPDAEIERVRLKLRDYGSGADDDPELVRIPAG